MNMNLRLLDVVALMDDLPANRLRRGQVGTIVEELAAGVFEVEFSDDLGRTYATTALRASQLLALHYHARATIMPIKPQTNGSSSSVTTEEPVSGAAKLERLKARLFPSESEPTRVARALEAIQKAVRKSSLSSEALKEIALHVDLEGF
jgi:hypothetical protein